VPFSGSWKQHEFLSQNRVVVVVVVVVVVAVTVTVVVVVAVTVTVAFVIAVAVLIVVEISSSLIFCYEVWFMGLVQETTNNFVSIQP
jgi:hypothetical protein